MQGWKASSMLRLMNPFERSGLPPDDLNSFLAGPHSDPFRILGPHRAKDDLVIRVFRPDAKNIEIVQDGQTFSTEKIHRDGFFQATVPHATRDLDYRLRLTSWDESQQTMRDPYQYGP